MFGGGVVRLVYVTNNESYQGNVLKTNDTTSVGAAVLGHVTGAARPLVCWGVERFVRLRARPGNPVRHGVPELPPGAGTSLRTPVRNHPRELFHALHFPLLLLLLCVAGDEEGSCCAASLSCCGQNYYPPQGLA